ncbi:8083_t:CDS:2 [Paraglomus brasilianum]|uniref:8083_t:CDS:1 n=1 Tax=Paraglomus brasilianum TaxID=144538 RepID=A0A9N9C7J6_9GLOM|nr:8083_t:CDS:2 [Paraglomus brasilianum]
MKFSAVVVALALFASANAVPFNKRQDPKPFAHDNGVAAQKLNDDFKKLTPDSPCTAGENACVDGGFAQCVGNKFQVTQCAGGTSCFALPLVNKPGTSITCNAIKLAQDFQKLDDNSPCTAGQNACVKGNFAQCVNGKFVSMPCSGGLSCEVLPLVNSRGTSITCDTKADAQARIDDALKN